jgi:hypothetical protein
VSRLQPLGEQLRDLRIALENGQFRLILKIDLTQGLHEPLQYGLRGSRRPGCEA